MLENKGAPTLLWHVGTALWKFAICEITTSRSHMLLSIELVVRLKEVLNLEELVYIFFFVSNFKLGYEPNHMICVLFWKEAEENKII